MVFSQAPIIVTQKKFDELSEDVTDGQEEEIEMSVEDFCGTKSAQSMSKKHYHKRN